MLKGIDLQMVAFVGVSFLQDYVRLIDIPRMYYWDLKKTNKQEEDEEDRAA
ncbi:hypothetical protein [Bacillus sp. FJAT-45037]|uniref:hypothetical protein n=1 Tax=Bacillus sp. FJAT-45037 TaxID=2011007 RepID=UPI0018E2169C|nr:hypothetical protein [Bacillus sp. FJAT-45037]